MKFSHLLKKGSLLIMAFGMLGGLDRTNTVHANLNDEWHKLSYKILYGATVELSFLRAQEAGWIGNTAISREFANPVWISVYLPCDDEQGKIDARVINYDDQVSTRTVLSIGQVQLEITPDTSHGICRFTGSIGRIELNLTRGGVAKERVQEIEILFNGRPLRTGMSEGHPSDFYSVVLNRI